jgi:hypothetical protein
VARGGAYLREQVFVRVVGLELRGGLLRLIDQAHSFCSLDRASWKPRDSGR